MNDQSKVIIWAQKFRLVDAIALFPSSLKSGTTILFDERQASTGGRRFLSLLQLLRLGRRIHPANLTLAVHEADGSAANYRFERELEHSIEEYLNFNSFTTASRLRQAAKSYLASHLFFRVTFITMVRFAMRTNSAENHIVFLDGHPANDVLFRYYSEKDFSLRQSPPWFNALRIALSPLFLGLRSFFHGRPKTSIHAPRTAIWAEYYPADLNSFISRIFWANWANLPNTDIVFYFDRPDTITNREETDPIEAKGYHWIEMRRPSHGARLTISELLHFTISLLNADKPKLLSWFLVEFEINSVLWKRVFSQWSVKLLIQHQEHSWKQAAQAQGIEAAGGIMMGTHWSYFPYDTEPAHLTAQHVYFVWGEEFSEWLDKKGNCISRILPCGTWITSTHSAEMLTTEFGPEVRFLIGIFDSGYDYNIYITAEQLALFLDTILSLLERHSSWAAILKPKTIADYSQLPQGANILTRIDMLAKEGRLTIADRSVSPVSIGKAVNLCVCFSINSAGILVGATGGKAVHWDCSGWTENRLQNDRRQAVFYRDIASFESAIIAAAEGNSRIGDFSNWRIRINQFDDELGPRRVAEWVEDYIDGISKGLSGLTAMNAASDAYEKRHQIK